MGLTTKEFSKLLESGELVSEDFLPKFAAALHASLGQAAIEASGSAQAAFNRFGNSVNDVKTALGEGLMPTLASATEMMATFLHGQVDGFKKSREIDDEMRRIADNSKDQWIYGSKLKELAVANLASRKQALDLARRMQEVESQDVRGNADAPKAKDLSKEQLAQLATLQKELATTRAQTTLNGAEQEKAIEAAAYNERLEKYKGFTEALALVKAGHIAKLAEIDKKEADRTRAFYAKADLYESEAAGKSLQVAAKKEAQDREIAAHNAQYQEEYDQGFSEFQQQIGLLALSGADQQTEISRQKYQALRNQAREWFLDETELQKQLSIIDKAEAETRKRTARDEFTSRSQFAASMAGNLISAMDAFYGESKKNAGLHQTLVLAQIEVEGAMAAMAAFNSAMESGIPYPGNIIAGVASAALVELKTQAFAVKASRQHFEHGGIVEGPYSTGDRISVQANAGEMFLTPAQQANLFAMANGQGGGRITHNTFNLDYTAGDNTFGGGQNDWSFDLGDMMRRQPHAFAKAFEELVKKQYLQGVL